MLPSCLYIRHGCCGESVRKRDAEKDRETEKQWETKVGFREFLRQRCEI